MPGAAENQRALLIAAVVFVIAALTDALDGYLARKWHAILSALELTEGVAMYDPQAAVEIMDNLHELGIRMSIDDFGTGYSSLNYLKKFKVYKLKIDQSFVRDITTDQEDRAIVAAIISMSRDLGLRTIAEGVETIEQLDYLRAQGCNEAQGYYFNKPMPAAEIESLFYWSQNIQQ